jgi:hypothetical protein
MCCSQRRHASLSVKVGSARAIKAGHSPGRHHEAWAPTKTVSKAAKGASASGSCATGVTGSKHGGRGTLAHVAAWVQAHHACAHKCVCFRTRLPT